MTATSWGAPEHLPASPFESFRPHTPDMGFREQHSRPQTPDYAGRVHDEDRPALFNHARPWAHVWPFSSIRKEQRRALLESEHGCFRFVWPFIGKDLQPMMDPMSRGVHNKGHPASLNHANAWPHVWPLSEIRKKQRLESKYGSFRFVWPFMDLTSRDAHNESHPAPFNHTNAWPHVWPLSETRKKQQYGLLESKHGSFRFVWPFMGKDLQPMMDPMSRGIHNKGHPASLNHANAWPHVWPLSEIRKKQQLESKYGSFRFVWPFMDLTSRGAHNEAYPASSNRANAWPYVWPLFETRKKQRLESKHGSFRFVWPFMGKDLQSTMGLTSRGAHNEDRSASSTHANAWPHVWPLSETRKEQARALLESRYGGFRFVWPFMDDGAQRLAIDWTSSGSPNVGVSTMAMAMGSKTVNKPEPLAFVWPFFQTARFHPSLQSVVVPSTYPFLQICKFSSLSLFPLSPLRLSTYFEVPGANDGVL